jgi:hypothetical protein
MYQLGNSEARENRISCYGLNLDARAGGTRVGIGSHFQDELTAGQWLLVAGAWDTTRVSIYGDGVLRDSDLLDQSATGGVTITPKHGDAPVRIGTRDFNSFFQGDLEGAELTGQGDIPGRTIGSQHAGELRAGIRWTNLRGSGQLGDSG